LKAQDYSISVIVPIYNEIALIERSLVHISSFMDAHFSNYEILIIESGSTDGSDEICNRLAETFPNITVIHEELRSGFGSALRIGYAQASNDLIWLIVVDLPFPLETILRALPFFANYDCVFSYRSEDNRNIVKRFRSFVYNFLAKTILGIKTKHVNSAFRVFRREVVQSLHLISTGWTLDAEVLYEVTRRNVHYAEIPVKLVDRMAGQTSISLTDPILMIGELINIRKQKTKFFNKL